MKIHEVKLQHLRRIKEVSLDLSKPLTIIGGPMAIGKTTVQEAILAAMFERDKISRDSLISDFDPHSAPMATLHLSRGEPQPTIMLSRVLTDKQGEWREGGKIINAKGKALEKVQESLPISAAAAAMLLWGQQEDMAAVVEDFPADGHTLLTAATIKGSGPDPKQIVEELEKQFKAAKRAGKNPGSLTEAQQKVADCEEELGKAQEAHESLETLKTQFNQAKTERDRLKDLRDARVKRVAHLQRLENLLHPALKAHEQVSKLEEIHAQWAGIDEKIAGSRGLVKGLQEELDTLHCQYRVAYDATLADRIAQLEIRIDLADKANGKCNDLQEQLDSRERPDQQELDFLYRLQADRDGATSKMDATGLSFELSVETGSKMVEISEDNSPAKQISLTAGETCKGVVGNVVIRADDLRLAATGKEDVARLQRSIERTERDMAALFARFGVRNEQEFRALMNDKRRLEERLQDARVDLEKHLRDETMDSLRAKMNRLQNERAANNMTQKDSEAWNNTILSPAPEIEKTIIGKQSALKSAQDGLKDLERERPTDPQKRELQLTLSDTRKKANQTREVFVNEDAEDREPSPVLRDQFRAELQNERQKLEDVVEKHGSAQNEMTRLLTELKHAGPERPIESIEADLEEARAICRREEVLQAARERLKERIGAKIDEMSEDVPRELATQITKYLTELTGGAYANVILNEKLQVARVAERGEHPMEWEPHKLSTGEKALTALTVKVAVARAFAELGSPVFVILDDSLVALDPDHRSASEELLSKLVADGKLQVILITCHTDWALGWKERCPDEVHYIDFGQQAVYYRKPPALAGA